MAKSPTTLLILLLVIRFAVDSAALAVPAQTKSNISINNDEIIGTGTSTTSSSSIDPAAELADSEENSSIEFEGNNPPSTSALSSENANAEAAAEKDADTTRRTKMKSNNLRWAIHGIVTELYHNVFIRTFTRVRTRLFSNKQQTRLQIKSSDNSYSSSSATSPTQIQSGSGSGRCRQLAKRQVAVVTGATGGIGSQIAHELAFRGYNVVIAARDKVRGEALVEEIQRVLEDAPVEEEKKEVKSSNNDEENENDIHNNMNNMPNVTFVEYHADDPQSAQTFASAIARLEPPLPLTVLINNAGIMGKSKRLTMQVNLLGPAFLTFALLPLMMMGKHKNESAGDDGDDGVGRCTATIPTVINVGSSAHLRATHVMDEGTVLSSEGSSNTEDDNDKSWIDSLSDIADDDLSVYAQSKLALMQFSTLLRHWLPNNINNDNNSNDNSPPTGMIRVVDAHPGLVWTPLLRNHIGDKAVNTMTKTGLANLIYKSSLEGAQAIVSALDYSDPAYKTSTSSSSSPSLTEQVYFVNGRPGGYAASESASFRDSVRLWKHVLAPEVKGVVELPEGWGIL